MMTHYLPRFIIQGSKRIALHYYWNHTLPRTTEAEIDGVRFDLSELSILMRNRILQRGYEVHEAALCRRYLEAGDAVLELGAGIGYIGLLCQKIIGIRRYVMVEANPRTVELLKRNYSLNGLEAEVWNLAVTACDGGTASLNINRDFVVNTLVGIGAEEAVSTVETVSATFASILERMPDANALVVDIEGAERFIDFDRLPERINKLIIELHPNLIGIEAVFGIISRLNSRGFRLAQVERFDHESGAFALIREAAPLAGGVP